MKSIKPIHPVRVPKAKAPKAGKNTKAAAQSLEVLEGRIAPAAFSFSGPSNSPIDLAPPGVTTSFTVVSSDIIADLNLSVNISTPYADDVDIFLSHGGVTVQVYDGVGDTLSSFINATFDDEAASLPPVNGTVSGTFRSNPGLLSAFDGLSLGGTWSLITTDSVVPGDNTPLISWSISGQTAAAAPETTVGVSGNILTITDANGGTSNDSLVLTINSGNLRITDSLNTLSAGLGASQVNANTIDVPLGTFNSGLVLNTLGGNDVLTLNFSGGNFIPAGGITYNGGAGGNDSLVVTGGTTTTVTHSFANANDGSVTLAGALAGTITYTGLEPVTDNLSATNRVFDFAGGTETITLVDAAGATMTIDSTLGESVTFANPTTSLTINAGTGDDSVTITSMDAAYAGSLVIDGGANTDNISLVSLSTVSALTTTSETLSALPAMTIGSGGFSITTTTGGITAGGAISSGGNSTFNSGSDLTFNAGVTMGLDASLTATAASTISLATASADLSATGVGAISLTASRNIAMAGGSSVVTAGGNITLSGNAAGLTAGNFVGVDVNGGLVQSATGSISITGRGGNDAGGNQFGVQVSNGGDIIGGSSGTVSLSGNGGVGGGSFNYGVQIANSGSSVSATGAAITITGQGGGLGAGGNNFGVRIVDGALVETSTGTLGISGTGGVGTGAGDNHVGVSIQGGGSGSIVRSTGSGVITITGVAGAGVARGIAVQDGALVTAQSTGGLNFFGTGGNGASQGGLNLFNGASIASTGGAPIVIEVDSIGGADSFHVYPGGGTISGTGTLAIRPSGAATTIGIGTGATGVLNLDATDLGALSNGFSSITIGRSGTGTGAVDIRTSSFSDDVSVHGGTITVTGLNAGTNNVSLTTTVGPIQNGGDAGTDITGGAVTLLKQGATRSADFYGIGGNGGNALITVDATTVSATAQNGSIALASAGTGGVSMSITQTNVHGPGNLVVTGSTEDVTITSATAPGGTFLSATVTGFNLSATGVNVDGGPGAGFSTVGGGSVTLGAVTASGGPIAVTSAGSITVNGLLSAASTVALNGVNLNGAGNISAPAGTTLTNTGTGTLSGVISGGALVKTGTGTLTLSNANTYTGTTTINGGTLLVNGSLATSGVTVNSTGTLGGSGTIPSAVTTAGTGVVAPGNSPGILNTGNVTLVSGSTYSIEVNGATAGTQYDQLNVTGTVSLGGATLATTGTIASNQGQQIVIINNDGTDAVTGTFSGLAEGATVTINGTNFAITYVGGTGNDVVLTQTEGTVTLSGGNLTFTDTNGANSNDTLIVSRFGANIRINDPLRAILASPGLIQVDAFTVDVPAASVTGSLILNTLGGNDVVTVDFSGGNPIPAGGISYNGGAGGNDSLVVTGGTTTTVTHSFANANDGSVTLAGALAGTITYTGLEPVTDNLSATNRVFDFTGGAETITLVDAAGATMTIDSTLGESVTFANPTTSLTINAGSGDDSVTITSMDAAYAGSLVIDGGANTDNISLVSLSSLSALTTTSETIGALPAMTIGAGGLSITSTSSAITQSGAITVTGATILTPGAANDVTLANAANNFSTITVVNGNNVSLRDANALVLGTNTISGNYTVVTAGAITQSGVQTVTGTSSFNAGAGVITLTNAANNFTGAVSLTNTGANAVSITDVDAIVLGTSSMGTGTFTVTAVGITQTGNVSQTAGGGAVTLNSGAAAVNLPLQNAFAGQVSATSTAGGVTINNHNRNLVTANISAGAANINISTTGTNARVEVGAVITTTGDVTITSVASVVETTTDPGTDISGNLVTINSTNIIGAVGNPIEIDAVTLVATTSAASASINIQDVAGGLIVADSVTATSGAININVLNGDLQLRKATAGGGGAINAVTTTTGNVILGGATAAERLTTTGNVSINSAGNIQDNYNGSEIVANSVTLIAVTGIATGADAIDITANTLSIAQVTGNGNMYVSDSGGGLTVVSASTANGTIRLRAAAGNLDVVTATGGSGGAITLETVTSGDVIVNGVSTTGAIVVDSVGAIRESGAGDAGADLTGATLTLTAASGIGTTGAIETATGTLTATTATGGISLANSGVLSVTSLSATTSGDITLSNVGALSIAGAVSTASGAVTLTAASPITVAANITATGDILLSAGEISDAGVWADDFTLNGGVTVQSTAGNITIRAGDDILLQPASTVTAFGSVTLQAGFGDLDGQGNLSLLGTINSGAGMAFSSAGDIIVGLLNAPGQTISLTADSDNNGSGGIFRGGVAVTNIIADTLTASASTRIAAAPDAGPYGIHLVTQISNLSATVANGAGEVAIDNTGTLNVTSASTSDGNITLTNAGGVLTLGTVTAGGASDISVTTTGAGSNILVGLLTAAADDIVLVSSGSITDNNAAANNFASNTLSLTAATGIGAANALESTVSSVTATNVTGNIQLANTGALTVNGVTVTGVSGGVTISAASPLTVAANVSAPGAVTLTAGEISDNPAFADDLTVNAGVTVVSTANSVTLRAGDDVLLLATSGVTGNTGVTITAAFGDLDGIGGVSVSAPVTATTGNIVVDALSAITIHSAGGTLTATGGGVSIESTTSGANILGAVIASGLIDITSQEDTTIGAAVTSTGGDITISVTGSGGDDIRSEAAGSLTGDNLNLSVASLTGRIGFAAGPFIPLQTTANNIVFSAPVGGSGVVNIVESNGATVTGSNGTGAVSLTSTTGDWTIVSSGVDSLGTVNITASAGDILRSGGAANIAGSTLTLVAGGPDGDVGVSGTPLFTNGTTIAFTGTGTGEVFITEADGASFSGTTGSGIITLVSTTGTLNIGGAITTTGNANLTASAGDITRTAGTVSGNVVTLTAGGADGDIGASGAEIFTAATTLSFTATGTGDVFINELDNAIVGGTTGAGNTVTNLTSGGTWNVNLLNLSAASSVATIVAAGAIVDNNGAANNINSLAAVLTAGTGIGTSGNTLETSLSNLEASGGNAGVFITETDALTIGGISGMNGVSATAGNIEIDSASLTITEQISTPGNVDLDSTGSVTESGGGFISAALLDVTSVTGQTLNGANTVGTFTSVNTAAGTDISLQNTFAGFTVSTVTNQNGGNISIVNAGNAATVTGIVRSGSPAIGGNILIQTAGLLTVNANVNSLGGAGGTLTLGGLLLLNASPTVGFGNVTLQGGPGTLTINAPVTVASPLVLQSTEDINILAKVETTSLLSSITVLADMDFNGAGGVYIGDNVFIGSLKAGLNLDVRGSEYMGSFVPALANLDNGVMIDPNGTAPRLEAVGNVFVKVNNASPTSQIWLGGLVTSSASGDLQFDSPVLVTDDDARVLTHGAGDIIFQSTIDSDNGAGSPFDLRIGTDVGIVLFNDAVGAVAPLGDVLVDSAFDVVSNGVFNADSLTINNVLGTVEFNGAVTLTDTGTNLYINAVNLVTNAPVDFTSTSGTGNATLQVNNIEINDTVAGDGVLLIQPQDVARSIGVNAVGDLNLNSTEIGLLQNGFSQIIIGRSNGTGVLSIGDRVAPDSWLDPVLFRSQGAGGQIQLLGQLEGTDDGAFTFLAPTTIVNVPATPTIVTAGGNVEFGSFTAANNITLQSALDIETNGGDVLSVGTINGAFGLSADAGLGDITLNGSLTPTPSGTSIGGTTALASISLTGGEVSLRPNVATTGNQSYTGLNLQLFSGAYTSTAGSIAFNGPVTLSNTVGVFTPNGGGITFNGTVNNVADPSTVPGKGALQLNAGTGAILFTGAVGGVNALRTLDIGGAGSLTLNDDFEVFGSAKIKADEIDFLGGDDSVSFGGAVELRTSSPVVQIEVGGAETATPNSLSLSADDIAALADGADSILISPNSTSQTISVIGAVTFHDPVSLVGGSKTGGSVTVSAPITGDTADGGVILKALSVYLGSNITTAGGNIDISNGVLTANVVLDTSAGGGDVTLRDKFNAQAGGEDLTISTGSGDINILSRLADRATGPHLGDVVLESTGTTTLKLGGYMASLLIDGTDGGGTTLLGGRVQTSGAAGQSYGDAVQLISTATLVSTHANGVIHFADTVDSQANKKRGLSIQNRVALAGTEVVTFDAGADLGLGLPLNAGLLGNVNIQTKGDVSLGGNANAVGVAIRAGAFEVEAVSAQKALFLQGEGTFGGALTADKLTVRSNGDINNGGVAWTGITSAMFASKAGDITLTGANVFGTLTVTGDNVTIEEAGNMLLGAVRATGTLDLTTTAGGNLSQVAGQRVQAGVFVGDIAGNLNLAYDRNYLIQIGDNVTGLTAGNGIEIWSAHPRAAVLEGNISTTAGDIVLVANPNGRFGYFVDGGNLVLNPGNRWVIYSYYDEVVAANSQLSDLGPTSTVANQSHPLLALPGGNVLVYVQQTL